MIKTNAAFDYLREYKKCEEQTEEFVMKKLKGKVSQDELITIFEKGIGGDYGKLIVADPQTILGWVEQYQKDKQKKDSKEYLNTGLLDPATKVTAHAYHVNPNDWCKEANKCFTAFLNGVQPSNFHPHVYDRMMLDNKIEMNAYKKHLNGQEQADVDKAKQWILKEVFQQYRDKGWTTVYFI